MQRTDGHPGRPIHRPNGTPTTMRVANINRQRQPGANAHGLARCFVHQEKINLGCGRSARSPKVRDATVLAWDRLCRFGRLCLSWRLSAATRLSIRSTLALIVRRSGRGSFSAGRISLSLARSSRSHRRSLGLQINLPNRQRKLVSPFGGPKTNAFFAAAPPARFNRG